MSLVCRDSALISQAPNVFRIVSGASLVAQTVKTLPVTQETRLWSLGVGKIPWRREQPPTPVFSNEESHGQRSLVGYSPWGLKESDTTEWLPLSSSGLFLGNLFFKSSSYFFYPVNLHGSQDTVSLWSGYLIHLKFTWREFSRNLVVRTLHSLQWPRDQSLVGELTSHRPHSAAIKIVHGKPGVFFFFFFWLKERAPVKVGVHLSLISNQVNVNIKL